MRVRIPVVVRLRCACGAPVEMSARADLKRRKEGREPVCWDCRFPPVIVVTEGLVEWWRSRGFTPESAREICDGWPGGIREVLGEGFTDSGFVEKMSA